ncbi:MAG: GNAT family N-acetyltransferase [Actinobacteria bacterium]|nr:GNAT family N-acetyltransferase [Actinomycetota bacterium]
MLVRTATEADWDKIYPFFKQIVDAGETYAYPEGLSSDAARALWMPPSPWLTVVARSGAGDATPGSGIAGSATMGPNRPGRGAHIATASFMVAPHAQGQGVGRRLGERVIEWAGATGYRGIQFNAVVETNTAAVHLWKALGFEIIGTVPGAFDHRRYGAVGLHVMFRPL